MDKIPGSDKYIEKKIAEMEEKEENLSFLPKISLTDLMLLGAIAMFLIGSILIWAFFPGTQNYKQFIKEDVPAGDFSNPGVISSEKLREQLSDDSLKSIDPELYEELKDSDEEYWGSALPKSDSKEKEEIELSTKGKEEGSEKIKIDEPTFILEPVAPTAVEDQENLSEFVDPKLIEKNPSESTPSQPQNP